RSSRASKSDGGMKLKTTHKVPSVSTRISGSPRESNPDSRMALATSISVPCVSRTRAAERNAGLGGPGQPSAGQYSRGHRPGNAGRTRFQGARRILRTDGEAGKYAALRWRPPQELTQEVHG